MKSIVLSLNVFALISFISLATNAVCGQQTNLPQNQPPQQFSVQRQQQPPRRPHLLQFLNLAPDQVQQIRVINQETREQMRAAVQRQRQARRNLDAAIYADAPNQSEVEQRARELAEAQSEATRLRVNIEFRVRQVLTTEQLINFRQLRRRAEERFRQRLPRTINNN